MPSKKFLGKMAKILAKSSCARELAQDLAQYLRQDPGQDFGCHNLATLYKILGKSWASSLAQELFARLSFQ